MAHALSGRSPSKASDCTTSVKSTVCNNWFRSQPRGPNLFDFALCSLSGAVSASVVPAIADHKGVLVSINLPTPKLHVIERTVWVYKQANWEGSTSSLEEFDFADVLAKDVDSAV